MQLHL